MTALRLGMEHAAALVRQWATEARKPDARRLVLADTADRLTAAARTADRAAPTPQPEPIRQPADDTSAQIALF